MATGINKVEEQHLAESYPEMKDRTGNIILDSDIEVKQVLALPTPPSSKRRVVANFASPELAGAQQKVVSNSGLNVNNVDSSVPNLILLPPSMSGEVANHGGRLDVIKLSLKGRSSD